MRKSIALLCLWLTGVAHAEMGFYHLDNLPPNVPPAVVSAAASVFRVWVPGGNVQEKYLTWTKAQLDQRIKDTQAQGDLITSTQLQFCESVNLTPCIVMDDIIIGTGFLLERGDQLWSCQHVFMDYLDGWSDALREANPGISAEEIQKRVRAMPVPLMVFDQNGKKIPTNSEKHFVRLTYRPDQGNVGAPDFLPSFRTDYVAVQLPLVLGPGLSRAKENLKPGDDAFILGFPTVTTNRQSEFGVPDSTGDDKLHLSYGPRVALDEALNRLGVMNSAIRGIASRLANDPVEKLSWNQGVDFLWADAEHGNSGGPALNARGEVVGLAADIQMEYRGVQPPLTATMVIDLNGL